MAYIDVPIETEPVDLADEAFSYIESQIAGWLPAEGNLESILVAALSQVASELRTLASLVPESIFTYYGESILGLPPYPAVAATGSTTWTALDTAGYQVTAGTLVGVNPPASSQGYAFEVVDDFFILGGTTQLSGVQIRALEAGAAASGLSGTVEMLDVLDFIGSVTLDGPTSGGQDAELIDAYLNRLSDLLTLLSPRPILPQDFAILVQRSIPGVARATAIDLYNPSTGDTNCPRCVTVAVVGPNGTAVPAQTKADADALLQSQREVNFLAFIIDPNYTTIDVAFSVQCFPGYVPASVAAQVTADLTAYLSPQNWGVPPYGDSSAASWINDTKVRYLELTEVANRADGVHYVISLTFGLAGQTKGTADITIPGAAPMPRPGTITGTAQ